MSKYYLTYLPPGEFGNKALWGVFTDKVQRASVGNWVAFFSNKADALAAYPNAVVI